MSGTVVVKANLQRPLGVGEFGEPVGTREVQSEPLVRRRLGAVSLDATTQPLDSPDAT